MELSAFLKKDLHKTCKERLYSQLQDRIISVHGFYLYWGRWRLEGPTLGKKAKCLKFYCFVVWFLEKFRILYRNFFLQCRNLEPECVPHSLWHRRYLYSIEGSHLGERFELWTKLDLVLNLSSETYYSCHLWKFSLSVFSSIYFFKKVLNSARHKYKILASLCFWRIRIKYMNKIWNTVFDEYNLDFLLYQSKINYTLKLIHIILYTHIYVKVVCTYYVYVICFLIFTV